MCFLAIVISIMLKLNRTSNVAEKQKGKTHQNAFKQPDFMVADKFTKFLNEYILTLGHRLTKIGKVFRLLNEIISNLIPLSPIKVFWG